MAIGIGENEYFIASDASPFIEYTNKSIYLEDGQMGIIRLGREVRLRKIIDDKPISYVQELQLNLEQIEKGGFDHLCSRNL